MFMLRLRFLVREEVSASRRDLMALSNPQLALAVRVPHRDRQVTAQDEAMVSDFTVAMPRNGLPRLERENVRLNARSGNATRSLPCAIAAAAHSPKAAASLLMRIDSPII
jgi:hypothetical protein